MGLVLLSPNDKPTSPLKWWNPYISLQEIITIVTAICHKSQFIQPLCLCFDDLPARIQKGPQSLASSPEDPFPASTSPPTSHFGKKTHSNNVRRYQMVKGGRNRGNTVFHKFITLDYLKTVWCMNPSFFFFADYTGNLTSWAHYWYVKTLTFTVPLRSQLWPKSCK